MAQSQRRAQVLSQGNIIASALKHVYPAWDKRRLQTFSPGCSLKSRSIVSSLEMVFPDPVGAPSRTLSSV